MVHTYESGSGVWNVADLWAAAEGLEPKRVPIAEVADTKELLDSYVWSRGRVTVREILDHAYRVATADLSKPIILGPEGQVCDGVHRLVRAMCDGLDTILAVRLGAMPTQIEPAIYEPDPGPWSS